MLGSVTKKIGVATLAMTARSLAALLIALSTLAAGPPAAAQSPTATEIDREVDVGLKHLYAKTPAANALAKQAKGILVFPSIVKGGLLVGGQYGKGALRKGGKSVAYYESVAASYGLQAGVQKFGYALFFMNDAALAYLNRSGGWEIGVGPAWSSWTAAWRKRSPRRRSRTTCMRSSSTRQA